MMSAETVFGLIFIAIAVIGYITLSIINAGGMRYLARKLVEFVDSHITKQKEDI